jgi:hypothetical protein
MLTTRYNILELKQLTNAGNKAFLFLILIISLLKNEYNIKFYISIFRKYLTKLTQFLSYLL